MMSRRLLAALSATAIAALAFSPSLADRTTSTALTGTSTASSTALAANSQEDLILTSFDGTKIYYTIFRPAGADAANPVPMVFSSHGWGGSRTKDMTAWMNAGFGGISFDQRGFGQSGDKANVEDPAIEGKDIKLLMDVVQGLDWVMRDVDATVDGVWGLDDPTVFASGGSYGGGYQTVGALTELADKGDTRFDALAPEITWYDLPESLGPSLVPRTAWLSALTALGANDVPQWILQAYAAGAVTGTFPDGTIPQPVSPNLVEVFGAHGPSGFVEGGTYVPGGGVRLNIPTLWRQGSSDTLFNLNQGIQNLENVDSSVAAGSYLIGYNGGHVLPTALPRGSATGSDTCSEGTEYATFEKMSMAFFHRVAAGESTVGFLPKHYGITDMDGACVWTNDVRTTKSYNVGFDASVVSGTVTTTGAGAPQFLPVFTATTKTVITGIPTLTADYYSASVDQRVFFGLAKGTSEADAVVMQHQMMPFRSLMPSLGTAVSIELGGGGMTVKPGETLYLVVSPIVDLYGGHGSIRTPGAAAFEGMKLHLPTQ